MILVYFYKPGQEQFRSWIFQVTVIAIWMCLALVWSVLSSAD